ncbi:MAG: hypothetical protein QXJ06_01935 [Candidatus Aenigmatarchaeota archaeon]
MAFKIIKDVFKTIILVFVFIIGFYLLFGYIPFSNQLNLRDFFSLNIEDVGRDKDQNLLLFVKNKWFFEAKNLSVFVDGTNVNITNNIQRISGRKSSILQVDWINDFQSIRIESNIGVAKYNKK